MRQPIDLPGFTADVSYPSSIFSLERHESIAHERLAFNVFREGIVRLTERHLPARLLVRFAPTERLPAWTINASVSKDKSCGSGFIVQFPELLPPLLMIFAKLIAPSLKPSSEVAPKSLRNIVQDFVDIASLMVRTYKDQGIANAIRSAYSAADMGIAEVQAFVDHFDALSYLIANHEVAHVYIQQLTLPPVDEVDRSAFEHLADLVATEWQFRRYVVLTPDLVEYHSLKKADSHAEAVFDNCCCCLEAHLSILILMGLSGAQQTGGRFHLKTGNLHPGGFLRFWLQVNWLLGGIELHFSSLLGEDLHRKLEELFHASISRVIDAGLISRESLSQMWNATDSIHVERALQIAKERNIEEIKPGMNLLEKWSEWAESMAKKINELDPGE